MGHTANKPTAAVVSPQLAVQRQDGKIWSHIRQKSLLKALGIPLRESSSLPKVFMLTWKELDRWSGDYLVRTKSSTRDLHKSRYPLFMLGNLAQASYGIQKSPANRPGKNARPYLRVANVQKGQLDLSEIKYIDVTNAEMEALRLKRRDLLVCEGNSAHLVGRPAIWNDEIPDYVHQNHILKVRLDQTRTIPEYVLEYMQTHVGWRKVALKSRVSAKPHNGGCTTSKRKLRR